MSNTGQAARKDDSRDGRLQYSNMAEHTLRKELNAIAIKECAPFAKSFGDCAKAQGLLVVIRCRSENNALNSCLHGYTNPESFEKFKDKRAIEIAAKSN